MTGMQFAWGLDIGLMITGALTVAALIVYELHARRRDLDDRQWIAGLREQARRDADAAQADMQRGRR